MFQMRTFKSIPNIAIRIFQKLTNFILSIPIRIFQKLTNFIFSLKDRVRTFLAIEAAFKGRKLVKSPKGYFFLDPMPSEAELNNYYSTVYWDSRGGKQTGVSRRDLTHYSMIKDLLSEIFDGGNRTFLNFGAGHGGLSELIWFDGFDVVNVEPSGLPQRFSKRWTTVLSSGEVPGGSVDLFYGSHSLEHVQDLERFMAEVQRICKPNAYVFWEVPNADHPNDGAMKNVIDIPHTYYFSKKFFEKSDWQLTYLDTFDDSLSTFSLDCWRDTRTKDGDVIRAIGKLSE